MPTQASLLLAISVFAVSTAYSSEVRQFSYEGVRLGSPILEVNARLLTDCSDRSDKRFVFCWHDSEVGGVRLQATLTFAESMLSEVHVLFPAKDFDLIWQALRERYGAENARDAGKMEWYSNQMKPDLPIPDEVLLHRRAPDSLLQGKSPTETREPLAAIEYRSMQAARNHVQKVQRERDEKVRSIGNKL